MLSRTYKTTLLSAAALAVAMVAQAAGASMITQWDYTILSGFSNAEVIGGNPVDFSSGSTMSHTANSDLSGTYTRITATDSGGDYGGNASWIDIDGKITGTGLYTNQLGVDGATFTHHNETISEGTNTLSSFLLNTSLTLTALAPSSESGSPTNPATLMLGFESSFIETDNILGDCSVDDSGEPCSDIFVLGNASTLPGGLNADGDFVISQGFTAGSDSRNYMLFLTIAGLGPLDNDVCTNAGVAIGCIGLTTMESHETDFISNLRIRAVPAPGTLSIFGLGMLCLIIGGGLSRKRRAGKHLSV